MDQMDKNKMEQEIDQLIEDHNKKEHKSNNTKKQNDNKSHNDNKPHNDNRSQHDNKSQHNDSKPQNNQKNQYIETLETELSNVKAQYKKDMDEARSIFEAMQQSIKKEQSKSEELSKSVERLQTDYRNLKKRNEELASTSVQQGRGEAGVAMIEVLDVVYSAMDMITDKSVKDGVSMISKKMEQVLSNLGIQEVVSINQTFDPEIHNALMRVEVKDEKLDGKVVDVLQKGYSLGGKVIRHAQVKVGYTT